MSNHRSLLSALTTLVTPTLLPLVVASVSLGIPALTSSPLSSTAQASVVEALDLETLVKDADQVVLVHVIKQWCLYDDHGRIVTDYQVQVERTEKGDSVVGSALVVRKLGGIVGDRGMRVAGEPSFEDGELVLLFGTRGKKKTYLRPVGMGQGTMRVYEQDGVRWARSDAQGMLLLKRGDGANKSREPAMAAPRKLDDVLADVRAIVSAQAR